MPAIILGIRPGDSKLLERQAKQVGRDVRELAGIYLEQAIRRAEVDPQPRQPAEDAR